MDIIDNNGRLFGSINVIDAFVVFLVLGFVGTGVTFVLTEERTSNEQTKSVTTVTVRAVGLQPYVADTISEGPVESNGVAAVRNKSVQPTEVVVPDQNGTLHTRDHPRQRTVVLRLSLDTVEEKEEILFGGKPLEVGRELTLDLGPTTVTGNVTNVARKN